MIRLEVKQIVGAPDKSGWSQIHQFLGLEKEKREKRGEMVLLVSLRGMSEETATSFGREVISRIYEEYYGNLEGGVMDQLSSALKKVGRERPVFVNQKVKLTLVVLVVWKRFVYLGRFGEGEVLLFRAGQIFSLLGSAGGEVEVISGKVKNKDIYLLGTSRFFSTLPSSTISGCLRMGKLDFATEIILPLIHAKKRQGELAAAVVGIDFAQANFYPKDLKESQESRALTRRAFGVGDFLVQKLGFFLQKLKRRGEAAEKGKRKSWQLFLATIFLFLLLLSVFFGWQKSRRKQKVFYYNQLFSEAQEKLKAAWSIKQLDPQNSLSLVEDSLRVVEKMEELGINAAQTAGLRQEAEKLKLVLGGGERKKPQLFFDLSLLDSKALGDDLFFQNGKLFILDSSSQKVFSISWPQKSTATVISGEQVKRGKVLVGDDLNKLYLFGEDGVYLLEKESSKKVFKKDWENVDAVSFWLGNLYFLDKSQNSFWKLVPAPGGFKKVAWFKSKPNWQWGDLVDFDIDGEIWFLDKKGKIYRFLLGQEVEFDQKGGVVQEARFLRVAEEAERLVFWDEGEQRLRLLDKKGGFLAQVFLDIKEPLDLEIDDRGEAAFFLKEGKVYLVRLPSITGEGTESN